MSKNTYKKINQAWWEKMVKDGCGFTKPWLDLDKEQIRKIVKDKSSKISPPLNDIYPIEILEKIKGKKVLCLAASGGQQSAIFALLGAKVTVVDIAEGQLEGDQKAAKHYGYKVETVQTDMNDLSALKKDSFDLVYQAPSMAYVPDVKKVYKEVSRVLKQEGIYRVDAENPLTYGLDEKSWDGKGYRISVPYSIKEKVRSKDEEVLEFRHTLSEVFNGLIKTGFKIEKVEEMPKDLYQNGKPKLNTWEHLLLYAPGSFAIVCRKI